MRVLVCLSSLPRHFDDFVNSFLAKVVRNAPFPMDLVGHFPVEPDKEALDQLVNMFENRLIKVAEDPAFTWQLDYKENLINNQEIKGNLLQWHSMACCRDLKQQLEEKLGIKYDWVIWSRPDIWFFNEMSLYFNIMESDLLHVPAVDGHGGLNDRFCMGSSEVMDKRMNILHYFLETWYPRYHQDRNYLKRKGKIWSPYYCWNPEMVLKQLLVDEKISFQFLDLVIGKIRARAIHTAELVKFVSIPFFDSGERLPTVKRIQKALKQVTIQEFEEERTDLMEMQELQLAMEGLEN